MEVAIEAYWALVGHAPATEADLVTEHLLRQELSEFDLDASGNVVVAPGSSCTA